MPQVTMVSPFAVTYDGNDAERHLLATRPLGHSMIGAAKLYSAVTHYCVFGQVPRGNYKRHFECYTMPAQERCYEITVLVAAIGAEWNLHGHIYKAGLDFLLARVVQALKEIWLKPGGAEKVAEVLADAMKHQADKAAEVLTVATNGLVRANDNLASLQDRLIQTLPQLADVTRSHGALLVAPVGNTCKTVRQFTRTEHETEITEPEAEVIRGSGDMEVDEMQQFRCKEITELNRTTGHSIFEVEGYDHPITGSISDPALQQPDNVYSRALNDHGPLTITAKAVKKNGVLHKLFISDAKR